MILNYSVTLLNVRNKTSWKLSPMAAHSYMIRWDSSSISHCKDTTTQPPLQTSCHLNMYLALNIVKYPLTKVWTLHLSLYSMNAPFVLKLAAAVSSTASLQTSSNHKIQPKLSLFNSRKITNPSHYYVPLLIGKPSSPVKKSPKQKRHEVCKKKCVGPQTMPSNHTLLKTTSLIAPLPHTTLIKQTIYMAQLPALLRERWLLHLKWQIWRHKSYSTNSLSPAPPE